MSNQYKAIKSFDTKPFKPGGFREFVYVALPLIISKASITVMNFVDRLFLSWSSTEEIAAAVPAGTLFFTLIAIFFGTSEYTNTFVAQYYGANRPKGIASSVWQGIYFSLISSVICFVMLPVGWFIFDLAGHDPKVAALEKMYFSWLMVCAPFIIINHALSGFYSGRGKTQVIMTLNVLAHLLNGFLDYALIFGKWGMPELGLKGAAIATVIAQVLLTVIYFCLILGPTNHQRYGTRTATQFRWPLLKKLIRYGSPVGIQFTLDIGSFAAFSLMIGSLGNVELAASNIVMAINMLAFFPMIGAEVATCALVGQYIGRGDKKTAEKCAYTAWLSVEGYMIFFALIYVIFPEQLMLLFQGDYNNPNIPFEKIVDYGSTLLWLVAIYQISDGMILTFSGALRGAGDTFYAMWVSVIFAWCFFVPGAWIILHIIDWGIYAAWGWTTLYLTIVGLLLFLRFRSGKWKNIDLIGDDTFGEPRRG